jgi:hypothetical protein
MALLSAQIGVGSGTSITKVSARPMLASPRWSRLCGVRARAWRQGTQPCVFQQHVVLACDRCALPYNAARHEGPRADQEFGTLCLCKLVLLERCWANHPTAMLLRLIRPRRNKWEVRAAACSQVLDSMRSLATVYGLGRGKLLGTCELAAQPRRQQWLWGGADQVEIYHLVARLDQVRSLRERVRRVRTGDTHHLGWAHSQRSLRLTSKGRVINPPLPFDGTTASVTLARQC